MTQKEAKELTLELWRYLAEHPWIISKSSVPYYLYFKICNLKERCPLCELFSNFRGCSGCPLDAAGEYCRDFDSAYFRWCRAKIETSASRKAAAGRIAEIVSAWEPEEEG
jgi:hypothetical protein